MKANKIIILVGIALLMSPWFIKSTELVGDRVLIRSRLTEDRSKGNIAKESSDEEIMIKHQFNGPINEVTVRGLPAFRGADQSFSTIRNYYNQWATVDRQGAAPEFKPQKQA